MLPSEQARLGSLRPPALLAFPLHSNEQRDKSLRAATRAHRPPQLWGTAHTLKCAVICTSVSDFAVDDTTRYTGSKTDTAWPFCSVYRKPEWPAHLAGCTPSRTHAPPPSDERHRRQYQERELQKVHQLKHLKRSPSGAAPFTFTTASGAPQPLPRAARPFPPTPGEGAGEAQRPPGAAGPCPAAPHRHHQQSRGRAALRPPRPFTTGTAALLPGTRQRDGGTVNQTRASPPATLRKKGPIRPRPAPAARPRGPSEARRPRPAPTATHAWGCWRPRRPGAPAGRCRSCPWGRRSRSRGLPAPPPPPRPAAGGCRWGPGCRWAAAPPWRGEARPAPASAAHGGGGDVATGGRGRAPRPASCAQSPAPPRHRPRRSPIGRAAGCAPPLGAAGCAAAGSARTGGPLEGKPTQTAYCGRQKRRPRRPGGGGSPRTGRRAPGPPARRPRREQLPVCDTRSGSGSRRDSQTAPPRQTAAVRGFPSPRAAAQPHGAGKFHGKRERKTYNPCSSAKALVLLEARPTAQGIERTASAFSRRKGTCGGWPQHCVPSSSRGRTAPELRFLFSVRDEPRSRCYFLPCFVNFFK